MGSTVQPDKSRETCAGRRCYPVLGVRVAVTDYNGACSAVAEAAREGRSLTVAALAVHGVMTGALDPEHRRRLNTLDLVVPDGQPVRWALNWLFGAGLRNRVYGPELMLRVCAMAEREGFPVALYGSRPEVLEALAEGLRRRYQRLRIVAAVPSRFGRVDKHTQMTIATGLRNTGAQIVFVGLGCPRQEIWAYENRDLLPMPVLAVGAAFDFHAGLLPQAPAWLQRHGLEWLFRLYCEPGRLWRRYLVLNPLYLTLLALQALGIRRLPDGVGHEPVCYEGYA